MNYVIELRKKFVNYVAQNPAKSMFLADLVNFIQEDIQVAFEKDPAARSWWEVLICYPGVQAVAIYRVAHPLYCHGFFLCPGFSLTLLVG